MPIYLFVCPLCKGEKKLMLKASEADDAPECHCRFAAGVPPLQTTMERQIGSPQARAVETGDEYHGLKMVQGVKDMAGERATAHFRKHELPRIIEKEGKEFAVRQGFIDEEGNVKI